jgi:hypothetical protein
MKSSTNIICVPICRICREDRECNDTKTHDSCVSHLSGIQYTYMMVMKVMVVDAVTNQDKGEAGCKTHQMEIEHIWALYLRT